MNKKKFIHEIKNECDNKTTFIILSAKKSTKRGQKNVPLFPINNKSLIDYQIESIKSTNINSEIIIISGFEHERIINYIHKSGHKDIRIFENTNFRNSTTLDGWRMGLNIVNESNVYIIHGDRIFKPEAIQTSANLGTHLITHKFDKNNYNLGISASSNILLNISYGLPNIWSEIFYIQKEDFHTSRNLINSHKKEKIYNIESFINAMTKKTQIHVVKKDCKAITTLKEML